MNVSIRWTTIQYLQLWTWIPDTGLSKFPVPIVTRHKLRLITVIYDLQGKCWIEHGPMTFQWAIDVFVWKLSDSCPCLLKWQRNIFANTRQTNRQCPPSSDIIKPRWSEIQKEEAWGFHWLSQSPHSSWAPRIFDTHEWGYTRTSTPHSIDGTAFRPLVPMFTYVTTPLN